MDFEDANFGKGDVNFPGTTFGGAVWFDRAALGVGAYTFDSAQFAGQVNFEELRNTQKATAFSFRHARFKKSMNLSSETPFACVPDLSNTQMGHHVSLHGLQLKCKLKTKKKDIGRLCRLKELAQAHQNTEQALAFKAQEMRAIRQHDASGIAWFLNGCFDKLSDYGRSELRPFCCFVSIWLLFGLWYGGLSALLSQSTGPWYAKWWDVLGSGFTFSASQMLPLIPQSSSVGETAKILLFPAGGPDGLLYSITSFQSILAIIFLFLIGLALRNRFRL